jgi:hypothetical protein
MERNVLKHKWALMSTELQERWPDLTESDTEYIYGDRTKLVEVVGHRRHISADEASRDVDDFLKRLEVKKTVD